MNTLSNFILKIANWQTLLVFFLLEIAFISYFLPYGFKSEVPIADQNLPIIDLQMTYDPENIASIVAMHTDKAKEAAIKGHIITDTIYPIVYFFLFSIILSLLFYKWRIKPYFKWINILPLGIIIFDYLENIMIIKMLNNYPADISHLAIYCSLFTMIKWFFMAIMLVFLLAGLINNLFKK
jgi:hypothetical protein